MSDRRDEREEHVHFVPVTPWNNGETERIPTTPGYDQSSWISAVGQSRKRTIAKEKKSQHHCVTATPMFEEADDILAPMVSESPTSPKRASIEPQPAPMAPPPTNRLYTLKRKKATTPSGQVISKSANKVKSEVIEEVADLNIDMSLLGPLPGSTSAVQSNLVANWKIDDFRLFFDLDSDNSSEESLEEVFRSRYQSFKRVARNRNSGKFSWYAIFGERGDYNQAGWEMNGYIVGSAVITMRTGDWSDVKVNVRKDIQKDKPKIFLAPPSSPPENSAEHLHVESNKRVSSRSNAGASKPMSKKVKFGETTAPVRYTAGQQLSATSRSAHVASREQQHKTSTTSATAALIRSSHSAQIPSYPVNQNPMYPPSIPVPSAMPIGLFPAPVISRDPRQKSSLYTPKEEPKVKLELQCAPKEEPIDPEMLQYAEMLKQKDKLQLNDFPPEFQKFYRDMKKREEERELHGKL